MQCKENFESPARKRIKVDISTTDKMTIYEFCRRKEDVAVRSAEPHPVAVLADEYERDTPLVDVFICNIADKTQTSNIVTCLCDVFPLPSLQHLKRVRVNIADKGLQVIVCLPEHIEQQATNVPIQHVLQQYNLNCSGLSETMCLHQVPGQPPLTRSQYEVARLHWASTFHEDKLITKTLECKLFSSSQVNRMEELMKIALDTAKKHEAAVGAVMVDPASDTVLAAAYDQRSRHPLQHAVMVCIDMIARSQGGGAWSTSQESIESSVKFSKSNESSVKLEDGDESSLKAAESHEFKDSLPYICTGYDLYTTREPCTMCSMALVHSRVSRVFYASPHPQGGLGSVYKIHTLPGINHRFQVFKGVLAAECQQHTIR